MKKQNQQQESDWFVVTLTCRDRVGIVSDVAARIGQWNGNIERFSQTVLMNYFTLIVVVTFPEERAVKEVREFLAGAGKPGEFELIVKVFEKAAGSRPVLPDADNFVLTATGPDQPGIIGQIARYLASRGINISDLYAYKPTPNTFVLISEVTIPRNISVDQVQLDLEQFGKQTGLACALQHENIFKATNEVTTPPSFV